MKNKKKYFLLILGCFLISFENESLSLSFYNFQTDDNYNNQRMNDNLLKPMAASLLVPGLGQYMQGQKKRAIFFAVIETLALYSKKHYDNKAEKYVNNYKDYSNQYWGFGDWIINHETWNDINNEYFDLFSNSNNEYQMIWDSSHHIDFFIDKDGYPGYMSTNNQLFGDKNTETGLYYDLLSDYSNGINFMEEYKIEFVKDHDFQEGIRKYDIFFAGWADSVEDINILYPGGGYAVSNSPHKQEYNRIWNESIDFYDYSQHAITVLYLNHLISMFDVYFKNKFDNRFSIDIDNKYNLKAETVDYSIKFSMDMKW